MIVERRSPEWATLASQKAPVCDTAVQASALILPPQRPPPHVLAISLQAGATFVQGSGEKPD